MRRFCEPSVLSRSNRNGIRITLAAVGAHRTNPCVDAAIKSDEPLGARQLERDNKAPVFIGLADPDGLKPKIACPILDRKRADLDVSAGRRSSCSVDNKQFNIARLRGPVDQVGPRWESVSQRRAEDDQARYRDAH